jgi:hypothetical protein
MGRLTTRQMTTAIAAVLDGAGVFKQVQSSETLAEGVAETPLVQVYLEKFDLPETATDRRTFGGRGLEFPRRPRKTRFHVDVYGRQRSQIGQDIATVQDLADQVDASLELQVNKPYFGLTGVEAFTYRAERVVFEYGSVKYAGLRFILELTTM